MRVREERTVPKVFRVGLIGCGGIGNTHGPIYLRDSRTELLGYCDIVAERADKSASRDSVKAWYSVDQMLSDVGDKLNMVSVCSAGAQPPPAKASRRWRGALSRNRAALIEAMLTAVAYHRVGNRPGRWEPRARKSRGKPKNPLTQPRAIAKLQHNRSKWY